ncbi:expressed unknown protein [Seminavis robusta]|uniref:Uncharacterized protein n=1 Tax=Seminavis robusta TaxID=568900 RepID=A0A9N8EDU6_9STRA|nr:expressed unknown protein [Seminavis robusta]|eukprot:Sro1008_g230540.1 n/a (237) ;mRNA; r:17315-18025
MEADRRLLRWIFSLAWILAEEAGALALSPTPLEHVRQQQAGRDHFCLLFGSRDNVQPTTVEEDQVWEALERIEALDIRLGVGCGATKERAKLQIILDAWEEQEAAREAELDQAEESLYDDTVEITVTENDSIKYVAKHLPHERVAILGGDPARRREMVAKKLAPFGSLDQFGSPRDVGPSDTTKLLQRIENKQFDVVYVWIRFNSHSSRLQVKKACLHTGTTRFEEVESLAYIVFN